MKDGDMVTRARDGGWNNYCIPQLTLAVDLLSAAAAAASVYFLALSLSSFSFD